MGETGAPFRRLLLFDGECGFCDRLVSWLLARDPGGRFHYAPLQGETAAALRARHPEIPQDIDTCVFIENLESGERVSLRSEAIFRILQEAGGPWSAIAWLRVLPRWLTDLGYRAFVRIRYRVFGRLDACRIPDPSEHERFLT